jgi:hypothetical protein
VFTKKKRQIGRGELLVMVLSGLSMMFHNLVPFPFLVVVFIAIIGIYLIWTRL